MIADRKIFLEMSAYQWKVLLIAWLGWGGGASNALLFNYVAPTCIPNLLGLRVNSPEANFAVLEWTGILTSTFLVGWAAGGILFGKVTDRIGRTRTFIITIILYSLGSLLCGLAPNIWTLLCCRVIVSLGVGGEWAAGATMVAEVVPEKYRVEAGTILNTGSPWGLFLAALFTYLVSGILFNNNPEVSWRYVFLWGLLTGIFAIIVKPVLREPDRWKNSITTRKKAKIGDLFRYRYRARTFSGLSLALIALITWWSCNTYIPVVVAGLAHSVAKSRNFDRSATALLVEQWKVIATVCFNLGGLIGILLTTIFSRYLSRRGIFAVYLLLSSITIMSAFGLELDPHIRLYSYFPLGLAVYGVFGSFPFYLPELFPTWLRGTGTGFCYNTGRIIAAAGPLFIGSIASVGDDPVAGTMRTLFWIGWVPVAGLLLLPWVVETRHRVLED